jgi:hypothetical protein
MAYEVGQYGSMKTFVRQVIDIPDASCASNEIYW